MWTVRKIKVAVGDSAGARNAARYPLEPGGSPRAFSPGGEGGESQPVAYWLGSEGALGQLGLKPGQAVSQRQLELALQGRAMDGGEVRRPGWVHQKARDSQGRIRRGEDGRPVVERRLGVASYDMTFSAPKSVSVLWSQAGPELRAEIERAMFEAWNVATEHLIRSHDVVMRGREGGEREYGPAKGFAAAGSLHVTARVAAGQPAPDPQLHIHGILLGLERPDGRLAAINGKAVFGDAALEAGAYARTLLAERLIEMGFQIESGTGRDGLYFEVRGVPGELIERMSSRSREVEEDARRLKEEFGIKLTNRQRARLAAFNRAEKEGSPDPEQVEAWWRARSQEFGFGPEAVEALRGEGGFQRSSQEAARDLEQAVEACMRRRGPAVSRAAARAIVVAVSSGQLPLAEAEGLIDALQDREGLLALQEGRVTTPWIRQTELDVVAAVRRAAGRRVAPLPQSAIEAGERYATERLGAGRELHREQREAIAKLNDGSGWSILTGRAGTGKTPVLQAIAEAHRQAGWKVIACAIDWNTAQELGKDIGAEPLSVRQVIQQGKRGHLEVDDRTLILIEEAGKVGLTAWAGLAEVVDLGKARLLGVGHAGQLGAVELPGMFEEMVRHPEVLNVAKLREIRRHEHRWMREVQEAIDDGDGKQAVKLLRKHNAITIYETQQEALEGMVERWVASRKTHGEEQATMILQGSNEEVAELNALAQEQLIASGKVHGPGVRAPDQEYSFHAGDRVVLRDAAYVLDPGPDGEEQGRVTNGTTGTVHGVDPVTRSMWVDLEEPNYEPRRVMIDLGRDRRARTEGWDREPSWRLAYAIHPNPAQGLSVDSINHGSGHWSQGREGSYVGLSRQRKELHDHVARERLGDGSNEEVYEELARRFSPSRRREASIRFGEVSERRIVDDYAAGRELPEGVAWETRQKAPPWAERRLGEGLDPLAQHRLALGGARAAWIERRAERYAPAVGRMRGEVLRVERAELREALERLDHDGAMRTLGLQRDREIAEESRDQALRYRETLKRRGARLHRRRDKEEREALLEVAATQGRLAGEQEEELAELRDSERELRREGVHLDQWMREEGDAAARYVALERELFARREPALEEEITETLREPPADVVGRVGPMPEVGSAAYEEWAEVVWELERNRFIAEGELPAAEPSARELQDLERRIERLRGGQDLGPQLGTNPAPDLDYQ